MRTATGWQREESRSERDGGHAGRERRQRGEKKKPWLEMRHGSEQRRRSIKGAKYLLDSTTVYLAWLQCFGGLRGFFQAWDKLISLIHLHSARRLSCNRTDTENWDFSTVWLSVLHKYTLTCFLLTLFLNVLKSSKCVPLSFLRCHKSIQNYIDANTHAWQVSS